MLSEVLSSLIKKANNIEEEIADLENLLSDRKHDLAHILEEDIPAVLHENGLLSAPLDDGRTIIIDQMVSVSQQSKPALTAWLESEGYGSVIKTTFEFPKGSDVSMVEELLKEEGTDYTKDISVHPQTLKKVIRDHIIGGGMLPGDNVMKVSIYERARIKGGE